MMIFTESLFWDDPLYVKKDGGIYATDARGREFEITPELIEKYHEKRGGRLNTAGNALGGAALGTVAGMPFSLAVSDSIYNPKDPTSGPRAQSVALPVQRAMTIGGGIIGAHRGNVNMYNDIVRARRAGVI